MRVLLTTARRFSTWNAATAKTLATEDKSATGQVQARVSPVPTRGLLGTQLTNDQAQSGPAVGVLQKQRHHLDGIHQDAVPADGQVGDEGLSGAGGGREGRASAGSGWGRARAHSLDEVL